MKDYKIVIDAGHGGIDSGATGNGIIEKDKTLEISKYMYNKLKSKGIPVTLTRSTDETLDPTERVRRILNAYGNSDDVIVISNHINAGGGDGAEVIYALRNDDTLANLVLNALGNAGQNKRKVYQRRLPSNNTKDYYFIHRNTGNTEPIIIEYGFLDSKADDVFQLKNNWKVLTDSVVDAILEYIGGNNITSSNTYVIQSGDSLWSIAKKFNTTVDKLKELNNLSSNTLSIGKTLIIPSEETNNIKDNYIEYIVKLGDTLYKISKTYNVSINSIKELNNLDSDILSIGSLIKIPVAPEEEIILTQYIEYTVKKGDTLYSIARNFDTTQQEIMMLNNLTSNLLSIGQTLKIPTSTKGITYVVKKGDNLYSIARTFGTTITDIMNKNNLSSTVLSIGQVLNL